MRYFLFSMILLFSCTCFSQIQLNGYVYDSSGKPISDASIAVTTKQSNLIISNSFTDSNGAFSILLKNHSLKDSIVVRALAIGFTSKQITVTNFSERIYFSLLEQISKLPPVTVKNNVVPIKQAGDTLTYNVMSYTSPQDRVIGDIIKKLPGIEMDDNGKIKYQGKEINRLYIDGDNLLDGRYNVATTSIGIHLVDKVQILENHQPIKALRNLDRSNEPALNISLKEKSKLKINTNGELAGGSPSLYQGTLNATLFKSKVKFINYSKLNNTGQDLSAENISHFKRINAQFSNEMLKISVPNPTIPINKKKYLFNNAELININSLLKLKNEDVLRINGSFFSDRQFQQTNARTQFFLPTDTVTFYEYQNNRPQLTKHDIQFTYTKNADAYYLNNTLTIVKAGKTIDGHLESSSNKPIDQQIQSNISEVMHELNYIKSIPSTQWATEFNSAFLSRSAPESLNITPGLFENQLNQGNSFTKLKQLLTQPTLYVQQSLSFRKKGKLTQQYKIEHSYEKQQLQSQLLLKQNSGIEQIATDTYLNKLDWAKSTTSLETGLNYTVNKLRLSLSVPVSLIGLNYSNKGNSVPFKAVLSSPQFNINWATGKGTNLSTSLQSHNELGSIQDVYSGYIMTTYRTLESGNNFIPRTTENRFAIQLEKKNPIKSIFISMDAAYSLRNQNYLSTNEINESLQQSLKTRFANSMSTQKIGFSISKYLFKLKTNWTNRLSIMHSTTNAINNNVLAKIKNMTLSVESALHIRLSEKIIVDYSGKLTYFNLANNNTLVPGKKQTKTSKIGHHALTIDSQVSKQLSLKTSNNYYFSKVSNSGPMHVFFLDATAIYNLTSLSADIEFSLTNLLGVNQLTTININENTLREINYTIRPRMMMAKLNFHF